MKDINSTSSGRSLAIPNLPIFRKKPTEKWRLMQQLKQKSRSFLRSI